ncbi:MAG: polysaccharide biosynthesis tyrosine autokinase, partial [Deltaproteobacteria bacterium]
LDHLEILRKRWRVLLATFVGFVAVATLVIYRMPPVYRATARVIVGSGVSQGLVGEHGSSIDGYLLERRSFETQLEVIRSEPVAVRAARRLGWIPGTAGAEEELAAAATIKGMVRVDHLDDTRIVLVGASTGSPERARDVANAMADAYIAYSLDQQSEAHRRSVEWLTSEIAALRDQVRASEERLLDYLAREEIDLPDETQIAQAAPERSDARLVAELHAAEIELSELLRRYRERHPKVIEARARLDHLRRARDGQQSQLASDHRKLIQYRLLKRDVELDHQMYDLLLKKLKESDLSVDIGASDVRILESAKLPDRAIAPRTARNLVLAFVLGLCFSVAITYLVEIFDRTVGSPEDVARILDLPTLAVIRSFDRSAREGHLVAELPGSFEGEVFRSLRTNLRFSHVDKPRRVVLVTSTGPEEGKSTVLSNLAVSLAQGERKTLVVDTDMRRPSLHRMLELRRTPGLAEILAGDIHVDEAIQSTRIAHLDALPCGTVPVSSAELIESASLQQLLCELRSRYDYVLLDSPPAGGLVDAPLLSALADGVLLVVEPGRFDHRVVRRAVQQLETAGARLYGVVLNKARGEEPSEFYRYYSYGASEADAGEVRHSPAGAA